MRTKLLTTAIATALASAAISTQAADDTPAPDITGMEISAIDWAKSVVMGWNLGNSLESAGATWDNAAGTWTDVWMADYNEWETAWGNPKTTREMIHAVSEAGFNAVRIPVRWVPHITDYTTMAVDPTWMSRVKEIIDWCLDEGMLVIVNTHHEMWLESNPFYAREAELKSKLQGLWTQIATELRDYDYRLAFSGTNEVTVDWAAPTAENQAMQNRYNQWFVDAVRATGGKNYYRNLVVQTYACDPNYGLSGLTVPTDVVDGHLSVEFHYYSPYSYCGAQEGCYYYWGDAYRDRGTVTPDGNERSLAACFAQARQAWEEQGLGVVIGEYGVAHHFTADDQATQEENQSYYLQCLVAEARKNGFAAFVWDNNAFGNGSEYFGIFNRNNSMSIDAPYFLNGIVEGSKTEFSEEISGGTDYPDVGAGGRIVWTGSAELNWGEGLQLKLDAKEFSAYASEAYVVLYYDMLPSATYDDIQFCNPANWTTIACSVDDTTIDGNFSPRNYYGLSAGSPITAFCFTGSGLQTLKSSGLIIQGYGVRLTKVVVIDSLSGIEEVASDRIAADAPVYTLTGVRATHPTAGQIYIVNGKKVVWHD